MRWKRRLQCTLVVGVALCICFSLLINSFVPAVNLRKPQSFFHRNRHSNVNLSTPHSYSNSPEHSAVVLGKSNIATVLGKSNKPFCGNTTLKLTPYARLLTVTLHGQLGNNMFQYASLLGLASTNNRTSFVLPRSLVDRYFQITRVQDVRGTMRWQFADEPGYAIYSPSLQCLPKGPLLLRGYLQSFKYFTDIGHVIRREFTFPTYVEKWAYTILRKLLVDHRNATKVGVHARRGDLLWQSRMESGHKVAPVSYFRKAFAWMRNKYKRVVFVVVSDDLRWASVCLKKEYDIIVLPRSPVNYHLCVLTKCDHTIMSVGTLGWWAGWLAGGDVIYYNQPLVPNSTKGHGMKMEDHFPSHWTGLGS